MFLSQPASHERTQRAPTSPIDEAAATAAHARVVAPSIAPFDPPSHRASLVASFAYAWQGIVYVVRTQRNARIHLTIGMAVLVLAGLLRLPVVEWAILLLCMVAVIVAEMMNTVVEAVVDLATSRYHPLAKVAKDVAAGAVLVTAIGSVGIGFLILGPHLWHALVR